MYFVVVKHDQHRQYRQSTLDNNRSAEYLTGEILAWEPFVSISSLNRGDAIKHCKSDTTLN